MRNKSVRSALKTYARRVRETLAAGDQEAAETALRRANRAYDRAASKGVIHRNNASARLTARWVRPPAVRRPTAAPPAAHTAAVGRITVAQTAATTSPPASGVRPGGRNVPAAARANSHPLGLANWKATPPSSPSGRAATAPPAPWLVAIRAARYSR